MYALRCWSAPIPRSCFRALSDSNPKEDSLLFILWCLGLFFSSKVFSHFLFLFLSCALTFILYLSPWKVRKDKYTFLCCLYCSIIPCINAGISSFLCFTEHFSPSDRHTWKPNLMRYDFYHFSYFYVSKVIKFIIIYVFISWKTIFFTP